MVFRGPLSGKARSVLGPTLDSTRAFVRGAVLGTTLLVSEYWRFVGTPDSISETGLELARQTLSILTLLAFLGLMGGGASCCESRRASTPG